MDGKISKYSKYGFYLYKIETSSTFKVQMYRNQIRIILVDFKHIDLWSTFTHPSFILAWEEFYT